MENPVEEMKDVIRGLVCKPTLERQEEVLRRYFTPDATFYHFDVNDKCLDHLIATYQMAELTLNYQDVTFYHITYDEKQNAVAAHMVVDIRPAHKLFFPDKLHFHALLELVDRRDKDGRMKKFIKVQRDYFMRDPVIQMQPVIGDVYNSDKIRFLIGKLYANTYRILHFCFTAFVPYPIQGMLYELWLAGPHGMPATAPPKTETSLGSIAKAIDAPTYGNGSHKQLKSSWHTT